MPIYKIRKRGTTFYSSGVVNSVRWGATKSFLVRFNGKGKEWTQEKNLKAHLLKCMQSGIKMDDWEVVEVIYQPTKPILDWFDQKMLVQVLKK